MSVLQLFLLQHCVGYSGSFPSPYIVLNQFVDPHLLSFLIGYFCCMRTHAIVASKSVELK